MAKKHQKEHPPRYLEAVRLVQEENLTPSQASKRAGIVLSGNFYNYCKKNNITWESAKPIPSSVRIAEAARLVKEEGYSFSVASKIAKTCNKKVSDYCKIHGIEPKSRSKAGTSEYRKSIDAACEYMRTHEEDVYLVAKKFGVDHRAVIASCKEKGVSWVKKFARKEEEEHRPHENATDVLVALREIGGETIEKLKEGLRERIAFFQRRKKMTPEQIKREDISKAANFYLLTKNIRMASEKFKVPIYDIMTEVKKRKGALS